MKPYKHLWILLPIAWGALTVRWMTMPLETAGPGWLPIWIDKPAHAAVFALFAWLCLPALRIQFQRSVPIATVTAILLGTALGAWTEYLQLAIPYRTGTLGDLIANTLGALTPLGYPLWLRRTHKGRTPS